MPWISNGLSIDWEAAERYLAQVDQTSAHGQDRVPTRAKFIVLARHAKAGRIVLAHEGAEDTIDLLARYPGELSADEMHHADPMIELCFSRSPTRSTMQRAKGRRWKGREGSGEQIGTLPMQY